MANRSTIPDKLATLVRDAMGPPRSGIADLWSFEFDGNRVHFSGPGPSFTVRDKEGFFTITYEFAAGRTTTRHYEYGTAVRFLRQLFDRPAIKKT